MNVDLDSIGILGSSGIFGITLHNVSVEKCPFLVMMHISVSQHKSCNDDTFRCLHIPISGRDFLSGGSFQPGERRFGKIFKPDSVHFHKIVVNKATNFEMIFPSCPDVQCIAHNIVVVLGEEAQIQAT